MNQKNKILALVKDLSKDKNVTLKELEACQVTSNDVRQMFGSLRELRTLAGAPTYYRKQNMSDEELKSHIKGLVENVVDNGCWVTKKVCKNSAGRPQFVYKGRMQFLSRVVHVLFLGPIKKGMSVLHSCDNPECFNPDHLRQGTALENAKDKVARGRHKSAAKRYPCHKIRDPYNYEVLLAWAEAHSNFNEKGEWLYFIGISSGGYPQIRIAGKTYQLHRLLLANKLGIKYEEVTIACHRFPEESLFRKEVPQKNDVNPDHLYDGSRPQNGYDTLPYSKKCNLSGEDVQFIFAEAIKTDWSVTKAVDFDMRVARVLNVSAKVVENVRRGKTYGSLHSNTRIAVNTSKSIVQMDLSGIQVAIFSSVSQAARSVGVSRHCITKVCDGKQTTSGGYMWMYGQRQRAETATSECPPGKGLDQ
jgi:hypothetical protein